MKKQILTLISMCTMFMVIAFDQNGLGVMLPHMQTELLFDSYTQMWIINVYLISLLSFILVAGKLIDSYNAELIFIIGNFSFLVGSIGCGFAVETNMFLIARAVQGLGASMSIPSMFVLVLKIGDNKNNNKMGIFIGITTIFFIIAPFVCAVITEKIGWRFVFLMNIPLCIVTYLLFYIGNICSKTQDIINGKNSLDINGVFLVIIGFSCTISGIILILYHNMNIYLSVLIFIVGLISFFLLLKVSSTSKNPIIKLKLFTNKILLMCLGAAFCVQGVIVVPIILSIYLQVVIHLEIINTGTYMMYATIPSIVSPFFSNTIVRIIGKNRFLKLGFILLGIGLLIIALGAFTESLISIFVGLAVFSLAITPLIGELVNHAILIVKDDEQGSASSLINLFRQLSAPLSMAIMSILAYNLYNGLSNLSFMIATLFAVMLSLLGFIFISKSS